MDTNRYDEDETAFAESLGDDLKEVLAELKEIVFAPRDENMDHTAHNNETFLKLLDRLRELLPH